MLAGNVQWNDEQTKICFTNTTVTKVDLYVIDVATHAAKKINKQALNIAYGTGIKWFDENTIMYNAAVAMPSSLLKKPITPKGPTIQQNVGSRTGQNISGYDKISLR